MIRVLTFIFMLLICGTAGAEECFDYKTNGWRKGKELCGSTCYACDSIENLQMKLIDLEKEITRKIEKLNKEQPVNVCGCKDCPPCKDKAVVWECNPECGQPIKESKRQEYIEKCDLWLQDIDKLSISDKDSTNLAIIATAYCTRALLEDK